VGVSDGLHAFASAGRCYEVQCANEDFKDGYGQSVKRSGMCE